MAKAPVRYQYEPPVIPEKWDGSSRRFAYRIIDLFNTVFQRLGSANSEINTIKKRLSALEEAGENQ